MNLTDTDRRQKLIDLITLNEIEGIGNNRIYQLITGFGTPGKVLEASIAQLTDLPGIGRSLASKIREEQNLDKAQQIAAKIAGLGWNFFLYDDSDYPRPLMNLTDRPVYLFYIGEYRPDDTNAIAIVGSRLASENGILFSGSLARELVGHKVTIVSGMARGIDTAAHRGALDAQGRTLAVFGCSLDVIYPPENRSLAQRIAASGCLFSEFLPATMPIGPNFPRRNRIISGLSQGVVVIEAAEKSGALSTAGHALAQNREVFAVPGPPRAASSRGTNALIKKGAVLLTDINDIFRELPRLKGRSGISRLEKSNELTEIERRVIDLFEDGPIHIDNLIRSLEISVSDLMPVLLALELKGLIKELSGKRFVLNY
jgi:DNA processing protein